MLLIIEGYNSSYSIWSKMKKDEKEGKDDKEKKKAMTYRNTSKRILRLFNLGLLNEIKPDSYEYVPHGRKDYSISDKGMTLLTTTIMHRPEEVLKIFQHMEKFGLDKHFIREILRRRFYDVLDFWTTYSNLYIGSYAGDPRLSPSLKLEVVNLSKLKERLTNNQDTTKVTTKQQVKVERLSSTSTDKPLSPSAAIKNRSQKRVTH